MLKTGKVVCANICKRFCLNYSRRTKTNIPLTSGELPRPAGVASMFRLPQQEEPHGLDACFIGVPIDSGTSNRPGARFGPRQIRSESTFVRAYNIATGADPYRSLSVADLGDVRMNTHDLPQAVVSIRERFDDVMSAGCVPLAIGGDHTITYPILQAAKGHHGPVGLIHVDAHDDTADELCGARVCHGTTFRRAGEEGCLDAPRVVQIGLRGSGDGPDEYQYAQDQGFRVVAAEDCWYKSLAPLMCEVRHQMGVGPVYLSFDIDSLDPAYAPGTGTPEIGGLTSHQALEIIRGCQGLNIIGCDLVEVSPAYDTSGNTSLLAANILFEMLCILPGVHYRK